jgi:hypothetical protein
MRYRSLAVAIVWLLMASTTIAAESGFSLGPPPPLPDRHSDSLSLSQGTDTPLMREPPALQYKAGHALVPFLGFGFSRGATTDVSGTMARGLAQQGSFQDERILRDVVGKTVTPNEVQLGIRLPF